MDRREPSQDEQGLELELDYFERVGLTARLALLRVAGAWAGPGSHDVDDAGLVVDDGLRERRFKPIAEPLEPGATLWRAAYAVPVELTGLPGVTYALDAGALVDLPAPTDRTLAPAAPVPSPAAAPSVNGNGHGPGAAAVTPPAPTAPMPERGNGWPTSHVRLSPEPIREDEEAALAELAELADGGRRPRWQGPALALAALVFIVGAGLLAVAVGSSDRKESSPPVTAKAPGAPPIVLRALADSPAGVRATLRPLGNDRVELAVRGLPRGRYEVWLYRSLIDARPVGTFHGPGGRLTIRLGRDTARYPLLDVSREDDSSPAHSGRSILRIGLPAVRRAAAAGRAG